MKINLLRAAALFTASASLLAASRPSAARTALISVADSMVSLARDAQGRSGALRTRMVMPGERFSLPLEWKAERTGHTVYQWVAPEDSSIVSNAPARELAATTTMLEAPERAGVYRLQLSAGGATHLLPGFQLVVKVPLPEKSSVLNGYKIGTYPASLRGRTDRYGLPRGLIEVDRKASQLQLSEHFKLGEFLTHDQINVWPKYAIVEPRLLDKLELVIADLNARGIRAEHMYVMSGYRTPQYNAKGLDSGRAKLSRHQYGDAADVWVDNDRNGYMDDLNGDGRRDTGDARVILKSVENVETRHPELIGGAGIYRDNGAHGPFIHIDTRGSRARW